MKLRQPRETATAYHTASPSTPQTYFANDPIPIPSSYGPNMQTSSSGTISPMVSDMLLFVLFHFQHSIFHFQYECLISCFFSPDNGDYNIQNSGNGPHHSQPLQHVHYHVTIYS